MRLRLRATGERVALGRRAQALGDRRGLQETKYYRSFSIVATFREASQTDDRRVTRRSFCVRGLVAVDGGERLSELPFNRNDRTPAGRIVVLGDVRAGRVRAGHTCRLRIPLNRELVATVGVRELRRAGHRTTSGNLINDRVPRGSGRAD